MASSLEDLEQKYARALEEKILLEHELQDKASLEEDMQRLRDELRGTHFVSNAYIMHLIRDHQTLPTKFLS